MLLDEVVGLLAPTAEAVVVDGTLGAGGHATRLLSTLGPAGRLIGLDVDDEAIAEVSRRGVLSDPRVHLVRASFRELERVLDDLGIPLVDAVLLDLGVSSRHLDAAERGFRFGDDTAERTPLDMRMDRRSDRTAAELLASASEPEIEHWLRAYGELPGAGRLARAIVRTRGETPLRNAADLVRLIRATGVGGGRKHHPATLVFQALRIAVNDEIAALEEGIDAALARLRPHGRLAVIAYHSLEDRVVKTRLRQAAKGCICPPRIPVCVCGRNPQVRLVTRRAVRPGDEECARNPRARSARLRVVERLEEVA